MSSQSPKSSGWSAMKAVQCLCVLYILSQTFRPHEMVFGGRCVADFSIIDPSSDGNTRRGVVDLPGTGATRAIVAQGSFQLVCLSVSRSSAFFMYPALIVVFCSKFRATIAFLNTTPFSLFMDLDLHQAHVYSGVTIFLAGSVHTVFHLARWASQGNLYLLRDHPSGISGLIAILLAYLICLPMMLKNVRERVSYEIRKNAHYLFFVFTVALCYHSPSEAFPNGGFAPYVFSTLIVWYALDWLYVQLFMSEKIETTIFHVLPNGVQMTMDVSDQFDRWGRRGYCYVCFPWVSKTQWHAFSLFENPVNPRQRQIFLAKVGDWTSKVHELLHRGTVRPVWVQGPFPSPYSQAEAYDNQILVASGIGITPALSVIRAYKESRRTNLIWVVRDPTMLEFFLEHAYLDQKGWNIIFYTGKENLVSSTIDELTSTNVAVVRGRPNLRMVIANIIYGIESGKGIPEHYIPDQKEETAQFLADFLTELDGYENLSSTEKMSSLRDKAREHGFVFSDIVNRLHTDSIHNAIGSKAGTGFESDEVVVGRFRRLSMAPSTAKTRRRSTFVRSDAENRLSLTRARPEYEPRKRMQSIRQNALLDELRREMSGNLDLGFLPWEPIYDEAPAFVTSLCAATVLPTWGMLFCGGVGSLENTLKSVAEEYGIDFSSESFSW